MNRSDSLGQQSRLEILIGGPDLMEVEYQIKLTDIAEEMIKNLHK